MTQIVKRFATIAHFQLASSTLTAMVCMLDFAIRSFVNESLNDTSILLFPLRMHATKQKKNHREFQRAGAVSVIEG